MTRDQISAKVINLIAEALGAEAEGIAPDSTFVEDLGADSLDLVELVMAFEGEFNIEIPDEEAEKIVSVRDAVDYIHANQPKA